MTTHNLPELWDAMKKMEPAERAGDYRMRLISAPHGIRVFAAVGGSSNDLSIVVDVPEPLRPTRLAGVQLRRVSVLVSELSGLPPSRSALILRLLDPMFQDLFLDLAEDVLSSAEAAQNPGAVVAAVCGVVTRWRRFMDGHAAPLTNEEARGLIGELAVLERLAGRLGPVVALAAWKSPFGSIRDFERENQSLEVKTYSPSAGATVRINDPLQLEPDPGVPLVLACQELGRSEASGKTLPDHAERVGSVFAGDVRLADEYRDALAGAGFLPCHSHLYTEGFALGGLLAFQVKEGFPRVLPATLMPGVTAVRFSLAVSALASFAVDAIATIGPLTPQPGPPA